jgi:2-methylisocitrate lyase-like PEP mutase family enzyme
MSSRLRTIDDIMEVTTKPIILDGDTGGLTEHFVYNVRTLERMGVSAVIIEDKTGLKKNSLFGTEVQVYHLPFSEGRLVENRHKKAPENTCIFRRMWYIYISLQLWNLKHQCARP